MKLPKLYDHFPGLKNTEHGILGTMSCRLKSCRIEWLSVLLDCVLVDMVPIPLSTVASEHS
uniref:Uncharacterized protein n=1 Tax=Timema cristinae TaxID=61476 RepID=A0A7R9CC03_TIMCR|nr:unnamed protein product [Timema cristinae]